MANIFHYEPDIDKCNAALFQTLSDVSQTGEQINQANLVTRYAYDTLFTTTTGSRPGFLDKASDISRLTKAMEDWKFHAIAYGAYLRIHELIAQVVSIIKYRDGFEHELSKRIHRIPEYEKPCGLSEMLKAAAVHAASIQSRECPTDILQSCVALIMAGSDPTITHILSSLSYVYSDPDLLLRLRGEIGQAELSAPPKIKELIHRKANMPLYVAIHMHLEQLLICSSYCARLHGVLQESLRLHQPHTNGFNYAAPEGGVVIDGKAIGEGVSSSIRFCLFQL